MRPFATGDLAAADSYLGVGIADAVSTALGTVPGLAVSPVDVANDLAGARSLGVGHLLEGTVQRSDEGLRVSARLVDVASGRTEWSERFERPQLDGAALQDAIARRVATSLPDAAANDHELHSYRPRAAEAYFLQLEARAHLKPFTRLPLIKALTLFEQALALDPDYAMAHAGLASTYLLMASTAMLRPLQVDEAMPMARRHAQRAIALDEGLAEAWAALGRVKMEYDWDWDGAEADLTHAVALNASSVEALGTFGQFLSAMGRHDEAIEAMEQARRLDPRSVETLQHLAIAYWMAGQGERALAAVDDSLKVLPGSPRAHYGRMLILDQLGRHDEAMAERLTTMRGLGHRRRSRRARGRARPQPGLARGDGGVDRPARAHQSLGGRGPAMDGRRRVVTRARCPRALREGPHHLPVLHGAEPVFPSAAQQSALPGNPAGAQARRKLVEDALPRGAGAARRLEGGRVMSHTSDVTLRALPRLRVGGRA